MTTTTERPTGWVAAIPFYYGWLVLGASAVTELLITGAVAYWAGLFILPLQAEFGLSRADASSPALLLYLGAAFCGPVAGRILDRFPIRPVICLGVVSFCSALIVIATSSSLLVMALALLVPGALGYMTLAMLNTATLATRWFYRRRGLALGIAAVATSGGGFITPIVAWAIHAYGWRTALLYEAGAIALTVLILTLIFVRDRPAQMGLAGHPENNGRNEDRVHATEAGSSSHGFAEELRRWRAILGNRAFWAPSLMIATISGISQAIVTAAVPSGVKLGFATTVAASLITAFSISAAFTKIVTGIILDLIEKKFLLLFSMLCMMAALALLCLVPTFTVLLAGCCLGGVALGSVLPTSASLIAARFGSADFGATLGWTYFFWGVFTIAAVRVSGTVFDHTGAYHSAFLIFLAFCAAISILALALELPRRRA